MEYTRKIEVVLRNPIVCHCVGRKVCQKNKIYSYHKFVVTDLLVCPYNVHVRTPPPLIWGSELLYLRSPKGCCCSISFLRVLFCEIRTYSYCHGVRIMTIYVFYVPWEFLSLKIESLKLWCLCDRIITESDVHGENRTVGRGRSWAPVKCNSFSLFSHWLVDDCSSTKLAFVLYFCILAYQT